MTTAPSRPENHLPLPAPRGWPITEVSLILVAMVWGASYGLTKTALLFTSVFAFIAIRFLLTFALLVPVLIRDFARGKNRDAWVALPTGLLLLAIFTCEVMGIQHTSAGNAAVLISLSVILTALIEALVQRRALPKRLLMLCVLSVVGVVCLSVNGDFRFETHPGDIWILTAALLRACMVTGTQALTQHRRLTALSLTALQSAVVGLGALSVCVSATGFVLPTEQTFWLTTLFLVVFCTIFAFYAQNRAVRLTSPTRVSLLLGSEPLFGTLFAVLWLQESRSLLQWFGALLIVGAVLGTSRRSPSATE